MLVSGLEKYLANVAEYAIVAGLHDTRIVDHGFRVPPAGVHAIPVKTAPWAASVGALFDRTQRDTLPHTCVGSGDPARYYAVLVSPSWLNGSLENSSNCGALCGERPLDSAKLFDNRSDRKPPIKTAPRLNRAGTAATGNWCIGLWAVIREGRERVRTFVLTEGTTSSYVVNEKMKETPQKV